MPQQQKGMMQKTKTEPLFIGKTRWFTLLCLIRPVLVALSISLAACAPPEAPDQLAPGGQTPDTQTPDAEAPSTPTDLNATAISSSQIALYWNASTDDVGVEGYRVYRDELRIGTAAEAQFTDTGLAESTLYTYSVRAFDASGKESEPSDPATAQTFPSSSGGLSGEWIRRAPSTNPGFRSWLMMTYDSARRVIALFGGGRAEYLNDVWHYDDGASTWTEKEPYVFCPENNGQTIPNQRDNHSLIYDDHNDLYWVFGGSTRHCDYKGEPGWYYAPATGEWTVHADSRGITNRYNPAIAYAPDRDIIVMFSGTSTSTGSPTQDTWVLDVTTKTWREVSPATQPPARNQTENAMVYDSENKVFVLFGGDDGSGMLQDTWLYDPAANTWTERKPTVSPPARHKHAMVYDQKHGKVVLFGGMGGGRALSDTWAYDVPSNTWVQVSTATNPGGRQTHAMAYDPINGVSLLYGGSDYDGSTFTDSAETWVLKLSASQ